MSLNKSIFVDESCETDWLRLKQKVFDPDAFQREGFSELLQARSDINRVLDCGTGEGDFAVHIAKLTKAKTVCGVDHFEHYLRIAKNKHTPQTIRYQQADIYRLPFANNTFDLVGIQSTFDILHGDLVIQEMLRVLRPTGWLYISMVYDSCNPWGPVYPDEELEQLICANIDHVAQNELSEGILGGDSKAGRKLWHYAYKYGLIVIKFSSSDWILYPKPRFTDEEKSALFVELGFYHNASLPEHFPPYEIDLDALREWFFTRKKQVENNELVFIMNQYSLLAKKPEDWSPQRIKKYLSLLPDRHK